MQEKAPRLNSLIIQNCKKSQIEAQKTSTSKTPQVARRAPQEQCRRRVLRITSPKLTHTLTEAQAGEDAGGRERARSACRAAARREHAAGGEGRWRKRSGNEVAASQKSCLKTATKKEQGIAKTCQKITKT